MKKMLKPEISDQMLSEIWNHHDDNTFAIVYQHYWRPLLKFAGKYIDDADTCKEVVQELFITLHIKRCQINVKLSLSSYLYRSLRNTIINYLRNQSVYEKHLRYAYKVQGITKGNNDVEQLLLANEIKRALDCCLVNMPAKYREVYVLHKQEDYTLKKTAFILNRPVDTVEKQYRKAVQMIRSRVLE